MSSELIIKGLSKKFQVKRNSELLVLDNLNLKVNENEFVSIVGPSGCGKSTLLMMIAGLEPIIDGSITVDGIDVQGPDSDRGMVFQSYTLFPWLNVRENIGFALYKSGLSKSEIEIIISEYIKKVYLQGFESVYPNQLSGGMRQRVAIARALAHNPRILLMDEPFGALDSQTRLFMQELLLGVWEAERKTVLFVTHDVEEAILISDRVYVMTKRPGRIKAEIPINLPRPRSLCKTEINSDFLGLRHMILELIREEAQVKPP